jgi:signal peptidase I
MQRFWRAVGFPLALLVIAALLARALFLDVWTIPDNDPHLAAAIAPTLLPGDTVLVLTRGAPGFGDLVRCTDPNDTTRFIAARIAGTEGDNLEIDDQTLRVNGRTYNGEVSCIESVSTIQHPTSGADVELACDVVRMGGGWHFRALSRKRPPIAPPIAAHVEEGMVYLLSDDRSYHDDSRDFGQLPRSSCKGLIFFRLWSKGGLRDEKHRFLAIH